MKKNIREKIDCILQFLIAIALLIASIIGLGFGLITENGTVLLLVYFGLLLSFTIFGFLMIGG